MKSNQPDQIQVKLHTSDLGRVERMNDGWRRYELTPSALLNPLYAGLSSLTAGYTVSLLLLVLGGSVGWWIAFLLPPILIGLVCVVVKRQTGAIASICFLIGIAMGVI